MFGCTYRQNVKNETKRYQKEFHDSFQYLIVEDETGSLLEHK